MLMLTAIYISACVQTQSRIYLLKHRSQNLSMRNNWVYIQYRFLHRELLASDSCRTHNSKRQTVSHGVTLIYWRKFATQFFRGAKGTVQRDFNSMFQHIWIGLGMIINRYPFLNFWKDPRIFDQSRHFCPVKENLFGKLYFSKIGYK